MFSIDVQKSIFLKSGQLITGFSKAWIGTNTKLLELPTSQDEESYQYTLLATKTFTLSGEAQASEGIEDIHSAALLPSLTADEYMSLKQLKIEATHTDFEYSAYSRESSDEWDVVLYYRYGHDVPSSGISTTFIAIPIFRHHVIINGNTVTRSAPSTDFGKAYASPQYLNGYKSITGSYAEWDDSTYTLTTYTNRYINTTFFDKLTYPFMTYQCDEKISLYATSGGGGFGWTYSDSRLSISNSVDITVKIYGAF